MAWRPPKQLQHYWAGRWITVDVRQVDQATLRDLFADDPDEALWGGWDPSTNTIYLLKTAPPAKKNQKFWHEVAHLLTDLRDPE